LTENSGTESLLKSHDVRSERDAPSDRDKLFKSCFERARQFWIEGEREQSVAPYNEFLSAYPDDALGCYWRGKTYLKLGKLDQALADLDKAAKANRCYEFFITRAEVHARKAHQDCLTAEQIKGEPVGGHPTKKAEFTGNANVLLVEDEKALRDVAARALILRGYNVLRASSGVDALRLLENHDGSIDLVICDVVMPDMDGPTLLKALRKRKFQSRIIFISGYSKDELKSKLDANEQFVFLPKPFSSKQLVEVVKTEMHHNVREENLDWMVECGVSRPIE